MASAFVPCPAVVLKVGVGVPGLLRAEVRGQVEAAGKRQHELLAATTPEWVAASEKRWRHWESRVAGV